MSSTCSPASSRAPVPASMTNVRVVDEPETSARTSTPRTTTRARRPKPASSSPPLTDRSPWSGSATVHRRVAHLGLDDHLARLLEHEGELDRGARLERFGEVEQHHVVPARLEG